MKQNNLKIAVTGGIGSGKSTVCKILRDRGYSTFSCDEVYADLLKKESVLNILAYEFGAQIIKNGQLNRDYLSEVVFGDKAKLQRLNEITHPLIFEEMFKRAQGCSGVTFFEVPLLFEGGYQSLFDNVIVVLRDEDKRVDSVVKRDNLKKEQVKKRILKQFNYDNYDFAQYYVIHNNGKIDDLLDIIDNVLSKITRAIL